MILQQPCMVVTQLQLQLINPLHVLLVLAIRKSQIIEALDPMMLQANNKRQVWVVRPENKEELHKVPGGKVISFVTCSLACIFI